MTAQQHPGEISEQQLQAAIDGAVLSLGSINQYGWMDAPFALPQGVAAWRNRLTELSLGERMRLLHELVTTADSYAKAGVTQTDQAVSGVTQAGQKPAIDQ